MGDEIYSGVGDAALERRTGRRWQEWFRLLDRAGAKGKSHREIVKLLVGEVPEINPWWQQQITVGYEQARGQRKQHEKPGGFEIGRSKTINVPVAQLYVAFRDARRRRAWLGESGLKIRVERQSKALRFDWNDGRTVIAVAFMKKSPRKSTITVQHLKLTSAQEADRMKSYWAEKLAVLKDRLEG